MNPIDIAKKLFGTTDSDAMGQTIEEMVNTALQRRRSHERRWYDNNFFDDGYHFRVVSRKTGQVIDHLSRNAGYVERAIPRASRQIRGVTNLLFAAEPYPVVYPKRISMSEFPKVLDEKTGQEVPSPEYEIAMKKAKDVAQKQGIWLSNEWKDQQELDVKLIDMILLAAKNSVAYLQVYSDPKKQKIITEIYDSFDIITLGDKRDLEDVPFITKVKPMDLKEIKSSPLFDPEKVKKLTPDNKYSTSEIKDAYMRSRYGTKTSQESASVIVKETFLKEYLDDENMERVRELAVDNAVLDGKGKGDMVMRHIFSAGGVTLADEYIDYDHYPFAEYRFEPGPLYQVPFIERFIPQNKSLDIIVTRLEKFVNSMVVGVYQKMKGENMEVSNIPGGQVISYEQRPLQQMNVTNPGNAPFQVIELLNKYMDEQGAATSVLGQIPTGVKANSAIESLQQQEYANLKTPTLMLKKTIKKIGELMLERAHKDFLKPVEVSSIEDGDPLYFDVIGQKGMELSKMVGKELPEDVVPLDKNTKIRIEIEAGLGLTMEGKKDAMKEIITDLITLYEKGFVSPEALQQVLKRYMEVYGYGSTAEFMEAMENGITAGQLSDNQIKQVQIAVAQVLKDVGAVGPAADKKLVDASKVGTLQSLKDAGLIDKMQNGQGLDPQETIDDMVKIYKDSPPDIRRQIEQTLGFTPSEQEQISPTQADTLTKIKQVATPEKGTSEPRPSN